MQYGALKSEFAANQEDGEEYHERNVVMAKARRVMNWVPILLAVFLPWFLFLFVFRSMASLIHYESPLFSFILLLLAIILAAAACQKAYKVTYMDPKALISGGRVSECKFYYQYHAVSWTIAVFAGWFLGDINFWFHMQPYYDIDHLATYVNVNPSNMHFPDGSLQPTRGKRYLDAGKVFFQDDVYLDQHKAMSFRNGNLYCVVPMVSKSCEKNCGHDFWAIGLNCCSDGAADFRCGEFGNPRAKSGLRLMKDDERPFYRLAVLQAEGVHKLTSPHPLFFYWVEDPEAEIRSYREKGYSNFIIAMFVFFFVNLFCLGVGLKTIV